MCSMAVPFGALCGNIIASGELLTLPQSSPFMKFAILPKNIPGVAIVAIMSATLKKFFLWILQNKNTASITPIKPPWLAIPPSQTLNAISGFEMNLSKS